MQNDLFIGYKTVSESHLRSVDCLCYKLFPSIQDAVFNSQKNDVYLMFGSIRIGFAKKEFILKIYIYIQITNIYIYTHIIIINYIKI